jgi:nucleoid-associated protein YgaU
MADRRTTKKRPVRSLGRKQIIKPEEKSRFSGFSEFFRIGESYTSLVLGIIVVIAVAALLVSFARTGPKAPEISRKEISATHTENLATTPIATATPDAANPSPAATAVPSPTNVATPTQMPSPTKAVPTPTKQQDSIASGRTYTVQAGDDLWKIAEKAYNDGYQWQAIAKANNITNPNMVVAGMKLQLPESDTIAQVSQAPTPTVTVKVTPTVVAKATITQAPVLGGNQTPTGPPAQAIVGSTYTVKHGDSLWDIAVRAYGNGYRWVDIARANNLQNPNIIHTGNVFTLPRKG